MSLFTKWMRPKSASSRKGGPEDWEAQLAELEAAAESARLGFRGKPLNQAGDVCLKAGDRERAVRYYGRAIDALLEDERPEGARGVANKIIRIHPAAIRTLSTLTWLDLAARHLASALTHLRAYSEAAQRGDQQLRAGVEIIEMARVVPLHEFLNAAGEALGLLGLDELASQVNGWAADGGSPDAISDQEELSAYCVRAASGPNIESSAEGAPA